MSEGRGEVRAEVRAPLRRHFRVRGPGVVAVRGHCPTEVGPNQHPGHLRAPRAQLRQGLRVPPLSWGHGDLLRGTQGDHGAGRHLPGDD